MFRSRIISNLRIIKPFTSTVPTSIRYQPFTRLLQTQAKLTESNGSDTIYPEATNKSILIETLGIFVAFIGLTFAFSATGKAMRLDGNKTVVGSDNDPEIESEFLFARGGKIKDPKGPVFTRDEATVVIVIGTGKAGKTTNALRIAKRFDMQFEAADSDIYSDIALNLPTAHLSNPHGSSKLRVVVDDFALGAEDPLAQALQFEESIAPILLFLFVDCPLADAQLRVTGEKEKAALAKEYEDWSKKFTPLIKHYRNIGNFLEITGQWPSDEQWEQVEAKLESALELEARGDL